ncbi:MAG: protein kinase [Microcoleaceae cyanobacterium MO_207.B10]|nr:protein kinase [Microcoleaceae cyanobacterium MO_207.B10]
MLINCPICGAENLDTAITCTACGCPLTNLNSVGYQLPGGITLQDKYRIEKTLGEGGFGITYQATDLANFTDVAIKELCPDKFLRHGINIIWPPSITPKIQHQQIQKFKTEAESLKKCIHPNIVRVINWFEANNTAYLVMEFVSGKPLSKILKERGKLPENIVKKYFTQIAEALKLVHANNFLHRDIKPDNIIINSQNKAILIDFGSAREFLAGLTNKMTAMLTPGYAPIEQYANLGKPNPSTDLYAVCASIYHALTGRVPMAAPGRLGSESLIFPRQIEPSITPQTEQIILTGMNMEMAERFQSADELIDALKGDFISQQLKEARQILKAGKLAEAVNSYKQCLVQEPDNGIAAVELAMILVYIDDNQAISAANQAIKISPDDGRVYGVLGLINCRQENWEQALKQLERAVNLSSKVSWIQANFAWALAKSSRWEEALIVCNIALELDSNSAFTLGLKAWILVNQKQWVEAIRANRPAITIAKQYQNNYHQKLLNWLYPCLIIAIDQELINQPAPDVDRCIKEFINQLPDSTFAWGCKGWRLGCKNQWQEAINCLEKASHLPEVSVWIFLNLGIAYEHLGNYQAAIQIYKNISTNYQNEIALFRLGTLLGRQQQWFIAKSFLEKAIKINANYAEAYHNLGWVLLNIKNSHGEIKNLEAMQSAYSKAVELYEKLGMKNFIVFKKV